MTTHTMKLRQEPFRLIQSGAKTVECRLYDAKRQEVTLGDTVVFSRMDDETRTLRVKVVGLYRYETFADMFTLNDPRKFGGQNAAELTQSLLSYYSLEQQHQNGVLGIEFKLL